MGRNWDGFVGKLQGKSMRQIRAEAQAKQAQQTFEGRLATREQEERAAGHKGGFSDPVHGVIDGKEVTAAFGWGTREGEVLLADGHVDLGAFMNSSNHNHYGSGDGPNNNVKERFQYTGSGS